MVYRQDNRRNKHKGRYTILGIVLGISLALAAVYLYDNNKQPILDNVNQVKQFAIKQIPKDSPIIQAIPDSKPVQIQNNPVENQPTDNIITSPQSTINTIDASSLESQINLKINEIRKQNNLSPLIYDNEVAKIARLHSQDMIINNYYDHVDENGNNVSQRFVNDHYPCYPAGENIAQVSMDDQQTVLNNIISEWINSPEHKTNILENFYQSEGIGVAFNNNWVYVTEDFC